MPHHPFLRYARSKDRHGRKRVRVAAEALVDLTDNAPPPPLQESATDVGHITPVTLQPPQQPDEEPQKCTQDAATCLRMRDEMQRLLTENIRLRQENESLQVTQQSFVASDEKVRFYTGLPSFLVLHAVLDLISPYLTTHAKCSLNHFQKLILVLMRLRLNLSIQDLAYRFNVSKSTVSRTFKTVIAIMYDRMHPLVMWPDRESLRYTMPMVFRRHFGLRVAVIIDCFEVFCEKPSGYAPRAQTWSSYKLHNTVKFLIGITPQGTVSFLSRAWGGRASDKFITDHCSLLDKLLPGDLVLADRGFDIDTSVGLMCAEVKIPAFTKGRKQLSPREVESTRKLANVRIHVERVIGLVRNKYTILQGILPIDYLKTDSNEGSLINIIATV